MERDSTMAALSRPAFIIALLRVSLLQYKSLSLVQAIRVFLTDYIHTKAQFDSSGLFVREFCYNQKVCLVWFDDFVFDV